MTQSRRYASGPVLLHSLQIIEYVAYRREYEKDTCRLPDFYIEDELALDVLGVCSFFGID